MGNKVGKLSLQKDGRDSSKQNGEPVPPKAIETEAVEYGDTHAVYENPKIPEMMTTVSKDNYDRLWPVPVGFMEAVQKDLEVRDDDLWLVTFPKCGTSWLTEIVDGIKFEGDFDKVAQNRKENMSKMPRLEIMVNDVKERVDMVNGLESPRTIVTHLTEDLVPQDIFTKKCKTIVLMRNPKDVACSWFHFHRMNNTFGNYQGDWDTFLQLFLAGKLFYGDVFDYHLGWWKHRKDANNLTIFYEDLKKDLTAGVKKIAKFMGSTDLSEEVIKKVVENCTFDKQKENCEAFFKHIPIFDHSISPFFRSGTSGGWMDRFSVAQNDAFDVLAKKKMARSDLKFDYGVSIRKTQSA